MDFKLLHVTFSTLASLLCCYIGADVIKCEEY